ncbi:MAG: NfeD family protein [Leptospiraceae bacterium]|nr:NfeD family protein [Leptospiraceae bacterium]MCP5512062.1 NfeD family protein [Leptospiraceae bacterium]
MDCLWNQGVVCQENILNSAFFLWLVGGIVLILMEFIIPGVYISFLGIGALVTAGILFIAPLSVPVQLIIWAISSAVTILAAGQFLKNLFPSEKSFSKEAIRDDYTGKIVKVVKPIIPGQKGGRILFQGTEWDAVSINHEFGVGSKVRIFERDNIQFTVEAIEEDPDVDKK